MKFLKIGSFIGAFGAVGGITSALSINFNLKNNVLKKFKEFGYDALDTYKDSGWDEVIIEYQKAPNNERFSRDKNNKEELKNKCRDALKRNDSHTYHLARRWCVKKQTIQEMLKKKGLNPLNTEANSGDQIWKQKVAKLIKNGNNKIKYGGGIKGNLDVDVVVVWGACKIIKLAETKTTNKDFEEEFIKAKEWCAE